MKGLASALNAEYNMPMNKKFIAFLSVLAITSSMSIIHASAAAKSGSACKTAGITSVSSGKTFTCTKYGKKLVWDKGTKLKTTSATVEPLEVIDYSNCLEEFTYLLWKLSISEYSNLAKDFGQSYSARLDKSNSNPRFGFDDLTFTNKTPCKVKVQIIAELSCYAPYGSSAYSYLMQAQSADVAISANTTYLINVGRFFPTAKYSCETTSPRVKASMPGPPSGSPYLNFGSSVNAVTIRVEGADPVKRTSELSPSPTPS